MWMSRPRNSRKAADGAVGLAALLLAASAGLCELGPQYRGFEVDGMGRSGTASIYGVQSLFLNPAGLADLQDEEFEASADLGLNSILLDYAKWAADNYQYINSIDSLLQHMQPIQNKWAPFSNSLFMQGHYQDFAVSMVEDVRYDLSLSKAVITPVPGVGMQSDLQIVAGRGFRVRPDWTVGFTVKYLDRLQYSDRLVGTTDEDFYTVKNILQQPGGTISDNLSKIGAASQVAQSGQGFGLNLGAQHQLPYGFTVGASLLDFPTFFDGGFLDPQLNLGGSYVRDFEILTGLHHRVILNCDWQMPFAGTPWFKQWKLGAGIEGRLGDRLVSLITIGLNDGYPAFGLKVGYIVNFYYLFTAEETGTYPGQRELSFNKLGLDFDF